MDYDAAFSNILCVNACYYQGLIAIALALIALSVVKYFIDWNRVEKKIEESTEKVKKETESVYNNMMNKWIRSFVLRGNPKYENNLVLRLTHNAFAIETINEVYPNISDEDFLFYAKIIYKHIKSDLDTVQHSGFPFEKNESNVQLIQNMENDLYVLSRKDNCSDIRDLLDYVSSFNQWLKGN